IVGTGNIFFKDKIGWLGNIMVDKNFRGKGFGYQITKFLVDFLENKGCETHLLIATKLGEAVYKKIGFKKMTEYLSFYSKVGKDLSFPNSIRKLKLSDLESVYKLDLETNSENWFHLIQKFYANGIGYFNNKNELLGFYLPKFGRGLIISKDKQAGLELIKLKHATKGKKSLLPVENQKAIKLLEKMGLCKGVKNSRMILGKEIKWVPSYIYSYGSGYCG
ncbi:GNAT family N-acetyltransferase, partial [Winogradskyella sp.]|uniref:GNAT family N-acetyltransferase n=1 Tax=Winogradskyella sp. TaxID=1883156 RepID=UPI0025DAF3AC